MPDLQSVPKDLEGNVLDLHERRLYRVIGEDPDQDGEWQMREVTPFPNGWGWKDVPDDAHLVGSCILAGDPNKETSLHAPCVDVDMKMNQLTFRDPDGGLPMAGIEWAHTLKDDGKSIEILREFLCDFSLAWQVTLYGDRGYKPRVRVTFHRDTLVHVMESSTPGHHHLYINRSMGWTDYEIFLAILEDCGLCSPAYVHFSRARHETHLRLPGVTKTKLPLSSSDNRFPRSQGRGDTLRSMGRSIALRTSPGAALDPGDPFGLRWLIRRNSPANRKVELDKHVPRGGVA